MRDSQPPPVVGKTPYRVSWPCRYCQARDTVVITWRDAVTLVCFCIACEQGWCATERGQPKD